MNFDQPLTRTPIEEISEEEKTFRQYIEDLKLNPEDFKKVILDVGAGEAHFAKWAKDHNISSQIYSLEPFQKMAEKEKGLIGNAEEIPTLDASFDLVVSNGAIPNIYLGEKDVEEKVKKSFTEMLRILKAGGEVRLARVLFGSKYKNQKIFADSVLGILKELQEKFNIKIDKIRTPLNDSYEYDEKGNKKVILAESFLIILRKPNSNNESSLTEQKTVV